MPAASRVRGRAIMGILCAFAVAVVWGVAARSARADALFTYGLAPSSISVANAAVAWGRGFDACYLNPAAMTFETRPLAGAGYLYADANLRATHAPDPEYDATQGLALGATIPLPFRGWLRNRIAFGVGFFFPNGVVLDLLVPYPTEPQYVLQQNAGRSLAAVSALSFLPVRGVAIGGGTQFYDNTSGQIDATVDAAGRVDATVGEELTTTFSPIAGVILSPAAWFERIPDVRLAFVFRDKFATTYEIPVNSYIGDIPLEVGIRATSLYTPRHYVIGLAHVAPRSRAEIDAIRFEWSKYPDPNLDIQAEFTIPILPISFQDSRSIDPNFHDTTSVRAGGEWTFALRDRWDARARAGYAWEPSPVPAQTGETNYLDGDRHVAAAGVAFGWRDTDGRASRVDLGGQYHAVVPRTFYKNSGVDADNPGYPKIGVGGALWAAGVSFTSSFDIEGIAP